MLSAFTARPIVELRQRDKSKIESILAYGDRLLVGLNTGCLRIYRVNEPSDDQVKQNGSAKVDDIPPEPPATTKPVDLLREVEKFSSKPIEQLAIIKEANILVSLSNSFISIHDLHSYTLQEQLSKTKSTTTFAVTSNIVHDSATGIPEIISRLAVAVKRRLLLWSWHESELSPDVTEITLAASIRTVVWASATKVICGMNSGYAIVDVISHGVEDIVGLGAVGGAVGAEGSRFGGVGSASMGYMGLGGYIPKPLITRLGDGEMLLAKDVNSVFIDSTGKSLEKRQIPWHQAPDSIGYSYPYLLALQPASKGALEVRNPETLTLLQTIIVPNAIQMHFPPPTVSLAHAGKGFHVASDRSIWRMGATDYDTQIDELVDKAQYDEALSLLNMLEDALLRNKGEREREIKMLKAQLLFSQRKYSSSLELYSSALAPPRRVISLYPSVVAGDLSILDNKNNPEGGLEEENGKQNGLGNGLHSAETAILDTSMGSPKPAALSKILKQHKKTASDSGSIMSFIRGDADGSDTASLRAKPMDDGPLEGKDLVNAVRELSSFLVDTRATRVQLCLDPTSGKLKPPDDDPIRKEEQRRKRDTLQEEPLPDDDPELEPQLQEIAKIVDTTLFRAYMLATPQYIGFLFRVPNFCDPDVVNQKLLENGQFNDLVEFFHGKKLHRPALELLKKFGEAKEDDQATVVLHGPQRTVGYLQNLPPDMIDLILEFAEWPLREDPDVGMEVFLADTENAETLPRERVVTFLQGIDVGLAVKYVEHLINELKDVTPDFHNWIVGAYIEKLKDQSDRDEAWSGLMGKLLSFLRKSKQYSLSKAFGLIPRDDSNFYEAQAVVLSNMGQHKQALEIYIFKLGDPEKAEEYCNRIHLLESSTTSPPVPPRRASTSEPDDPLPTIYHTLLSLYLTPPPPHKANWPPALSLLSKHGSRLPAASTLSIIPTTLPVAELESYFRGRIRGANSIVNESRVVSGLRKSEAVSAHAMLLLGDGLHAGQNRKAIVGEERVCSVCHKRLGRSVVAVLPDNAVVHYGCLSRAESSRVSGKV